MNKKIFIVISVALVALVAIGIYYKINAPAGRALGRREVLSVGTSADFPPFAYIENGAIVGFDIDLIREIANRIGKDLMVSDLPFFTLIPELDFGSIDLVVGGITNTQERAKRVIFSDPYLQDIRLLVITLAGNIVNDISDLNGKTVIVNDGYTADLYMSDFKDINLERIPTVADSFIALENGQAYAFVSADNTVGHFFSKFPKDKFSIYSIPETSESYCFAAAKNNSKLLEEINKILKDISLDGTLDKLKEKWDLK